MCVLYCYVCLHNNKTHVVSEHYLATAPGRIIISSAFKWPAVNVSMMCASPPDSDISH